MNVGLLMFLIVFIYAVLGINLFSHVKSQDPMSKRDNFRSFPNAFMDLIVASTGEGWNEMMEVLSAKNTMLHECKEEHSYEDYAANGYEPVGCGANKLITYLFFMSYTFLMTLVFLNLFIAIILDGYFEASDSEGNALTPELEQQCIDCWAVFDPDATGIINYVDFKDLMYALDSPLGWDQNFKRNPHREIKALSMMF
jgi:hypothetical protein